MKKTARLSRGGMLIDPSVDSSDPTAIPLSPSHVRRNEREKNARGEKDQVAEDTCWLSFKTVSAGRRQMRTCSKGVVGKGPRDSGAENSNL